MKQSAFPSKGSWFKGNIHSHTTLSDGKYTPERQIEAYKSHGYDFLAITDHNLMTSDPSWGDDSFLLLPAWERDIPFSSDKCTHLVGLFPAGTEGKRSCRKEEGNPLTMKSQDLIDEMGMDNPFISIAHPVWSRMEPAELLQLHGYQAIEVCNWGTECLCHAGHAEYLWDYLLRHGKKVLAVATDDTHVDEDHYGGWVMAKAESLDRQSILSSLLHGDFYATSGPVIKDWGLDGNKVYVSCSPCREIHFITWPPRGHSVFGEHLTEADHVLSGRESYLRIECVDEAGHRAWTNPIYF